MNKEAQFCLKDLQWEIIPKEIKVVNSGRSRIGPPDVIGDRRSRILQEEAENADRIKNCKHNKKIKKNIF